ncbi:MAG: hypothetical protein DRK00_08345 [Thermoprotei archaeon]|nr:MAG: hypothetical protein DRK00_08345 [Thermoprotei archaeon]
MLVVAALANLLVVAVLNMVPWIPSPVRAFLAVPGALLYPVQVGDMALALAFRRLRERLGLLEHLVAAWAMGFIAIGLLSFTILQLGGAARLAIRLFPLALCASSTLFLFFNRTLDRKLAREARIAGEPVKRLAVIALVSVAPFVYIRLHSQYPYQPMIDPPWYVSLKSRQFLNGEYKLHYYMAFPILVCHLSSLYNVDVIELHWTLPICQYVVLSTSTYLLAYHLTGNGVIAALSATLSSWFIGGGMICELYLLLPRNLMYIWYPMLLLLVSRYLSGRTTSHRRLVKSLMLIALMYVFISPGFYVSVLSRIPLARLLAPLYFLTESAVLRAEPEAYLQVIVTFLAALVAMSIKPADERLLPISLLLMSLYLAHLTTNLALTLILIAYALFHWALTRRRHATHFLYTALIITLIVLLSVEAMGLGYSVLPRAYARLVEEIPRRISSLYGYHYSFHPAVIWRGLYRSTYGIYGTVLYFVGLYAVRRWDERRASLLAQALLSLLTLLLLLLQFPYSYRMLMFLTSPLSILSSIGLIKLFDFAWKGEPQLIIILKPFGKAKVRKALDPRHLGVATLLLLTITTAYDSYIAYATSHYLTKHGISTFTEDDFMVAKFIRDTYGSRVILITDPVTLEVLSGITGYGLTMDGRIIEGSVSYPIYQAKLREIKRLIASFDPVRARELVELYLNYFDLRPGDVRVLVIINNRTSLWIRGVRPEFARPFVPFAGLFRLVRETKLTLNVSGYYYVFDVTAVVFRD